MHATVIDDEGFTNFSSLLIVNKANGDNIIGANQGSFAIKMHPTDTLLIGALGYVTQKYFIDKTPTNHMVFDTIVISKLKFDLKTVSVFAERDLQEIHEELENLQFNKSEYMLSGVDALQSPITFLYQALSKDEQRKRRAYEIIMEDRRKEVLKELFQKYVDADIIYLSGYEFDEFVEFCKLPDAVVKNLTQYEFIMLVKTRYKAYRALKNMQGE